VKVQQQAVTVAEKLYNDNRKQLEIGTMAPLDVTRAESELATNRQNLIVAQTLQLQDQQALKNFISKDPLAPNFVNVEIIPTDLPTRPETIEALTFEEAVKEAFASGRSCRKAPSICSTARSMSKRRATHCCHATLTAQYGTVGLAGNQAKFTTASIAGAPVVDANGNPFLVFSCPRRNSRRMG